LEAQQAKTPPKKQRSPGRIKYLQEEVDRLWDAHAIGQAFAVLVLRSEHAKESTMIDTRHLGTALDDIEENFDGALDRTHALTLASEALREPQVYLAHVDRITTMGRLTASVANEVTHPIAAILTDAQAARHFLDHLPPDLDEVREALDCIVRDAYRASAVIDRIRGLFKENAAEEGARGHQWGDSRRA
jgi:C4-dicarboxylate-specific signal transduction histidine kinase